MELLPEYDFIITGGGLAGLVVAARLSEDASTRVLVIEAGSDRTGDPNIDVPGLAINTWGNPDYDWNFWTEPQEHVNGRIIPQPRGKLLGGSSAINFAAIVYPTRENFAGWTALGNKGWSPEEMAPYLKKFHTFHHGTPETRKLLGLDDYLNPKAQGTAGPVHVSFGDGFGPMHQAWNETFAKLGFADGSDPIDGRKLGAFTPPASIDPRNNTRSYAASAYYGSDIASRPNLHVLADHHVERVLLRDGAAVGVVVESRQGEFREIYGHEVILSAGALQSPQILELSGIGRRDVLEPLGIPVVVERPGVGENLQDHSFCAVSFEAADEKLSGDVLRDPAVVEAAVREYQQHRRGPLATVPFSSAYLPPTDSAGVMEPDDVQTLVDSYLGQDNAQLSAAQRAQYAILRQQLLNPREAACQYSMMPLQMHYGHKTTMAEALAKSDARNCVTVLVCLNHPLSRGVVHIRSSDPKAPPRIDPAYLSHPLDLEILARGTQFLDKLVHTEPLARLLKPASRIPDVSDFGDLDVAKGVVRDRLFTTFHPAGTCAMMPRELGGVVDDKMRVYGVRNLRVVDASIMPLMTLGNIQATVYATAERAADIIKEDRRPVANGAH